LRAGRGGFERTSLSHPSERALGLGSISMKSFPFLPHGLEGVSVENFYFRPVPSRSPQVGGFSHRRDGGTSLLHLFEGELDCFDNPLIFYRSLPHVGRGGVVPPYWEWEKNLKFSFPLRQHDS
jgi:hypothetical protein